MNIYVKFYSQNLVRKILKKSEILYDNNHEDFRKVR